MDDHIQLKKTGLKATLPRIKILDIFENSEQRHLSAEDIYKVMISTSEEIGLATIYRVLTQFEQAGILIRHHFENSDKAVYELNEKLLPKYSQILSAGKEDRVDILVHVHYFGNVNGHETDHKSSYIREHVSSICQDCCSIGVNTADCFNYHKHKANA